MVQKEVELCWFDQRIPRIFAFQVGLSVSEVSIEIYRELTSSIGI
jgi:hypothetical protein